jgi:hypothetical protein
VYYKGNPDDGYRAYTWTDGLTSADLVAARNDLESEIRSKLALPVQTGQTAFMYEHSMGQQGEIPQSILRTSQPQLV